MPWVLDAYDRDGNRRVYTGPLTDAQKAINTHFEWVDEPAISRSSGPSPTPVTPTFDPKIDANALYGKAITLAALGFARIGSAPAPIVGPYVNERSDGTVDFIVSLGFAVPVTGNRKVYAIYLDNELAWSSVTGWDGSGALPGDSTFHGDTFSFGFRPGTLTQSVLTLESDKFPGDENAYRPQMLLQITGLRFQRFIDRTGKPVPYVACDIGDVTDGADPADGINLGDALERIAHSPFCGYDSSSFEAVGITDVVQALLLRENLTIDDLCQAETRVRRNLVYRLSDKRYIIDKGSTVAADIIFDVDNIIAREDGPVQFVRGSSGSQPRELELFTPDPDQDYTVVSSLAKRPRDPVVVSGATGKESVTLPDVMNASTRQSIVTLALYHYENARKKCSLTVNAFGLEIEPGDQYALVDIADGIENEVFRITEALQGANFETELTGEAIMRCAVLEAQDENFADVLLLMGMEGGLLVDESSYARAMSAVGNGAATSAWSAFGSYSYVGDGNGDGIAATLADNAFKFSGEFTVECFFRINTTSTTARELVACWLDVSGGGNWEMFVVPDSSVGVAGFVWATGATTSNIISASYNFTVGARYHMRVDRDASDVIRVYINGVMIAFDTESTTIPNATQRVRVGSNGSLGTTSFPGNIDEVRVSVVCRSGSDAGFPVPSDAFPRS